MEPKNDTKAERHPYDFRCQCPACTKERNRRLEKFWPTPDGYNDSREDVDRFNERVGGVW